MLTIKTILKYKLWIPSVIALVLIIVCLPLWVSMADITAKEPLGINMKNGDRIFYNFLERVKEENGVVILGTSETGNTLDGENYWALLDRDKALNRAFYSFGGAGRCSYMYFPLILDNPEAFKDLEIIFYINPTYWRVGLNNFRKDYFNRYVNPQLALSVKSIAEERGIYDPFLAPGIGDATGAYKFQINRKVENFKSLYHTDLQQIIDQSVITTAPSTKDITLSETGKNQVLETISGEMNMEHNCLTEFMASHTDFPTIDKESTFQDDLLNAFIQLVKDYQINCTFYLGPYNGVYCQKTAPERVSEHESVVEKIRSVLEKNDLNYIDGSYQSHLSGSFIDIQHISKYGAYLTALDIKNFYEKNN